MTAMNWGDTKGEAQSNKVTFMKMAAGENKIRIVGNIVRKYDYWVKNSEGNSLPFENLAFNRETESFVQGAADPVRELGLQHTDWKGKPVFDDNGEPVPMKCKKAYVCPVINRATNQIEYMELKKGVFDGINEVMQKVNDPKFIKRFADDEYRVPNPMFIDVTFTKSGQGLDTEYKVDVMEVMDQLMDDDSFNAMLARHKADDALIKDMKSPEEVFPVKTAQEQRDALARHLNPESKDEKSKSAGEGEQSQSGSWDVNPQAQEAMNELDD